VTDAVMHDVPPTLVAPALGVHVNVVEVLLGESAEMFELLEDKVTVTTDRPPPLAMDMVAGRSTVDPPFIYRFPDGSPRSTDPRLTAVPHPGLVQILSTVELPDTRVNSAVTAVAEPVQPPLMEEADMTWL
jgi:hypothetical protein